jgi:hypothetical protein
METVMLAALYVSSQVTPLKKQSPSLPQAPESEPYESHAVRKPVTCVLFSKSHADTLELVGLHVGGVELSSKVQKSGQLSEVAPAPSATSHAATFIHAVQKSTSSGGGPEDPEDPEDPETISFQLFLPFPFAI